VRLHRKNPEVRLRAAPFAALEELARLCEAKGIKLYLLITPSHPYDDYRIWSLGHWSVLEDWHRRLAKYPRVYTFAQYHSATIEPVSARMTYWYDPIHFSMEFGNLMLLGFLGQSSSKMPDKVVQRLDSNSVEGILRERRDGLKKWASGNRGFTSAFEKAKIAGGDSQGRR
jgi:hypothetical protein